MQSQLPLVFEIFIRDAWSFRFFGEIIFALVGFHLGGGGSQKQNKAKEMEGECFAFLEKMIQYGFAVH